MTVYVKAKSPADVLAMVPALVGFTPHNSLVLIAFDDRFTRGALRLDLPASTAPVIQKRAITAAIGMLCKLRGVDRVIPVICTEACFADEDSVPHSDFAGLVTRRLRDSGFSVRDALCLAFDGWASYLDNDIPAGGRPLSDLATVELPPGVVRELPPERVPDAPEPERQRVRGELATLRQLAERGFPEEDSSPDLTFLEDIPLLMELVLDCADPVIGELAALLLFVWQGPPLRDLTMLQWASDLATGDELWDEAERFRETRELDMDAVSGGLMLGEGARPDASRIERGIEVLLEVVARADDAERPAPLCMLAWLTWALGLTSHADRYLQEALSIRSDYGMAEVLATIFQNGMLPEWAFAATDPPE